MKVENEEINDLKTISDELANKLDKAVVFFINMKGANANFLCKCNNVNSQAGLLVKKASEMANGRGGGSATFAQGGASNVTNVQKIITAILDDIKENN